MLPSINTPPVWGKCHKKNLTCASLCYIFTIFTILFFLYFVPGPAEKIHVPSTVFCREHCTKTVEAVEHFCTHEGFSTEL